MRRRPGVLTVAAMTLDLDPPGAGTPLAPVEVDEGPVMRSLALQLQGEFPSVPMDHVSTLVECLWSHYDGAPVRDFVALLVGKQAREELSDHLGPRD
jgi:hypothetical protein